MLIRTNLLFAALALMVGCAPSLAPPPDDVVPEPDAGPLDPGTGIPSVSGQFRHSVAADGTVTTIVDATDTEAFHGLDLDTGLAAEGLEWDLAFSRANIRVNGGLSGDGGVVVAALAGVAFEDVTEPPADGFEAPIADSEADNDDLPDNVFNNGVTDWYVYDITTHTLTAADVTYVVAATSGAYFKLRVEAYYDEAGTPGFLRFRWAPLEAL